MTTQTDSKPQGDISPAPPAPPAAPVAVDYLSLDFISKPQSVSDAEAAASAPKRTRSEKQLAMDKIVERLHGDWIAKGKPAKWADLPKGRYPVPPHVVTDLRKLIDRSGDFLNLRIRYGTPTRTADGREVVIFAVMDKREVSESTRAKMAATRQAKARVAAAAAAAAAKPAAPGKPK